MKIVSLISICFLSNNLFAMSSDSQSVMAYHAGRQPIFKVGVRAQGPFLNGVFSRERENKSCFPFVDKQRIGICGGGNCLGGVVGVVGSVTGNFCCVATGLGCMAVTQAGVGVEMCLSERIIKAKKYRVAQRPLPKYYNEPAIITGHFQPVSLIKRTDFTRNIPNNLPGQLAE